MFVVICAISEYVRFEHGWTAYADGPLVFQFKRLCPAQNPKLSKREPPRKGGLDALYSQAASERC
jgi:hypothetical protein